MADTYLLLTPLLVLGVLALVRFIGCNELLGLDQTSEYPTTVDLDPPGNFVAKPGNQSVMLTWDPVDMADGYHLKRRDASGGAPIVIKVPNTQTFYNDMPLVNGIKLFYIVLATQYPNEAEGMPSPELEVTPAQSFVVSKTPGTLRNNFTGPVGMVIRTATDPVTVFGLGRIFVPGNSGTHVLKIADGTTGIDLPGASVTIDLATAGGTANQFVYGIFTTPILLAPNTEYYILSEETLNGDQWYDLDTTVLTISVAQVVSAVFQDATSTFVRGGGPGHTYGPVDFLF